MNSLVHSFFSRTLENVCNQVNEYAKRHNLEIISTNTVFNFGYFYLTVVFRKIGDES